MWMLFCIKLLLLLLTFIVAYGVSLPFKSQLVASCQSISLLFFLLPFELCRNYAGEWMLTKKKNKNRFDVQIRIVAAQKLDHNTHNSWMNCNATKYDFIFICPNGIVSWAANTVHSDVVPVHHLCIMWYTFDTCYISKFDAPLRHCLVYVIFLFLGSHAQQLLTSGFDFILNSLCDRLLRQSFNNNNVHSFPSSLMAWCRICGSMTLARTHFEYNQLILLHIFDIWFHNDNRFFPSFIRSFRRYGFKIVVPNGRSARKPRMFSVRQVSSKLFHFTLNIRINLMKIIKIKLDFFSLWLFSIICTYN